MAKVNVTNDNVRVVFEIESISNKDSGYCMSGTAKIHIWNTSQPAGIAQADQVYNVKFDISKYSNGFYLKAGLPKLDDILWKRMHDTVRAMYAGFLYAKNGDRDMFIWHGKNYISKGVLYSDEIKGIG